MNKKVSSLPLQALRSIARIFTCVLILVMGVTDSGAAQEQIRVSLNVRKASLESALLSIKKQTGYGIVYRQDQLKSTKPVTVSASNQPLEAVLALCFEGQPVSWKIVERSIIVTEKPVLPTQAGSDSAEGLLTIEGQVTDSLGYPLAGATVKEQNGVRGTLSDSQGRFSLTVPAVPVTISVSFTGFVTEVRVVDRSPADISVRLRHIPTDLQAVTIVSTGYQNQPKERATGSFDIIDEKLITRSVATNVLQRLQGLTPGMQFSNLTAPIATTPTLRKTGITIRGTATLLASKEPLIVVDNFPYEGEINNINANDIETITVLKDAAAASIWGARSANGVIVITTKKGRTEQPMKVSATSTFTSGMKPALMKDAAFMGAKNYIEVERLLFDKGYFNSDINNTSSRPTVSPAVEIFAKQRAGTISPAEAEAQLQELAAEDVRQDYLKHIYQQELRQQYHVGVRGGTKNVTYAASAGYDHNRSNLVANGFKRFSLHSLNTYSPVKNLEITTAIDYSQNATDLGNNFGYGAYSEVGGKYQYLFPYTRLADEKGNPLPVPAGTRESYLIDAANRGFQDWLYRPLDEIRLTDNTTKIKDVLMRVGARYRFLRYFSAELQYQHESQQIDSRIYRHPESYYVRNLVNKYSTLDPATGVFTYNFPRGGIVQLSNNEWTSRNARAQLNFQQELGRHGINAIAGAEARELLTRGQQQALYGYSDQFGTSVSNLNYTAIYNTNPSGSALLPGPGNNVTGYLNRFISYYANVGYNFDSRYMLTLSGRQDGANLFGARTNSKVTPLWSAGAAWRISNESFYHSGVITSLQLRATYGFNGNIYPQGSALLTGRYSTSSRTGAPTISSLDAPNPDLRWEKVRNINLGIDFSIAGNVIKGTIEYYSKMGQDLIQPTPLSSQTGFTTYTANTASTRTRGLDVTLQSNNLKGGLSWQTTLLLSTLSDKVLRYDPVVTSASIQTGAPIVGYPVSSVFSYKWAGLDAATGDPLGYLSGKASKDYTAIINNYSPDSLEYSGRSIPATFGALRNDFTYKGWSLSINLTYKLGYVFRRPTISLNYRDILGNGQHSDYARRWQKPGDESMTDVPSLVYPNNANRSLFYSYSATRIERGDHIRLQDIRFSYDFTPNIQKGGTLQFFGYVSNVGILWRKNGKGIDPDTYATYSAPRTFTLGVNANF